jgi:hypothetical protein
MLATLFKRQSDLLGSKVGHCAGQRRKLMRGDDPIVSHEFQFDCPDIGTSLLALP